VKAAIAETALELVNEAGDAVLMATLGCLLSSTRHDPAAPVGGAGFPDVSAYGVNYAVLTGGKLIHFRHLYLSIATVCLSFIGRVWSSLTLRGQVDRKRPGWYVFGTISA
jgi:hypothetical protein